MAISIPSDLVLDVARAADPTRVAKASADLNAGVPVTDMSLGAGRTAAAGTRPFSSFIPQTYTLHQTASAGQPMSPEKKAATDLETLLLQQMLESVLPKDDGVFGKGTAGSVWRSMMAEQVARQLATSGEIHLSKILTRKTG